VTLARLFSVPLLIWLLTANQVAAAFWVFVAAGLSDAVDGLIAKRFGLTSRLGGYLDPLADKALLVSVYVVLAIQGLIPNWITILVVSRDLVIVGGLVLSMAISLAVPMRPLLISKINTGVQIGGAAIALAHSGYGLELGTYQDVVYYLIAATTIASGVVYVIHWARIAASAEGSR
jgi:cardiolipin synthase